MLFVFLSFVLPFVSFVFLKALVTVWLNYSRILVTLLCTLLLFYALSTSPIFFTIITNTGPIKAKQNLCDQFETGVLEPQGQWRQLPPFPR
jgi:ABC-type transport system involved in cytochrome bd biosynthesis fused ATPase/permease subunit